MRSKTPSVIPMTEGPTRIEPDHPGRDLKQTAFNHDQSRSQVPPQSQFSQPHDSQLQSVHVPSLQPQSSHWQASPQQQLVAAVSAETVLKPKTEAPATSAVASNLNETDIVESPANMIVRVERN